MNLNNVTSSPRAMFLLNKRQEIENEILKLDPNALIKYEYEKLGLDDDEDKSYTTKDVINFILKERNKVRAICDSHTEWFETRIKTFHKSLKNRYEEGKDACRRIRNSVGGRSVLDVEVLTDEQIIKKEYNL